MGLNKTMIEVKSKIWFTVKDNPLLGQGRRDLLVYIDRFGSISAASKEMGISYRKAWSSIQAMEERLGRRLIVRTRGGRGGGAASLTDVAKDLIAKYDRVAGGVSDFVDHRLEEVVKV